MSVSGGSGSGLEQQLPFLQTIPPPHLTLSSARETIRSSKATDSMRARQDLGEMASLSSSSQGLSLSLNLNLSSPPPGGSGGRGGEGGGNGGGGGGLSPSALAVGAALAEGLRRKSLRGGALGPLVLQEEGGEGGQTLTGGAGVEKE